MALRSNTESVSTLSSVMYLDLGGLDDWGTPPWASEMSEVETTHPAGKRITTSLPPNAEGSIATTSTSPSPIGPPMVPYKSCKTRETSCNTVARSTRAGLGAVGSVPARARGVL